jgi:catechol 2,3-dioxygenase-like lactoylglutathione lyase family enzyme
MPRIGHIILNVSNFEISEAFYDRILLKIGFISDHREETTDFAIKSYRLNEHNIWIRWDAGNIHQPFVRDVGLDHIALFVDSKPEVDEMYAELKSSNARITRPPAHYPEYSPEYYAFYFRDPDEVPLEIGFC